MKKAVLFCENPYSFGILQPIAEVFKQRKTAYIWYVKTSIVTAFPFKNEAFTSDIHEIERFKSDAIFVPGNEVPYYVRGVKTQVFHGLAGEKKGHFRIRDYFDLYLTQGPFFTQRFQELQEQKKDFTVIETGWPKLDVYGKEAHKYEAEKKEILAANKATKIVLYAPTFSPSLTSAPYLLEEIKRLASNKAYVILIKFHDLMAQEQIDAYRKLAAEVENIHFESEKNIIKYLLISDLMISDTSSVVYEFLLLDKPVLTFKNFSKNIQWEDIKEYTGLSEKVENIFQKDLFKEKRRAIFRDYHPFNDGRSAERMVDAVDQFIEKNGVPEFRKLSFLRRFKIHKIFGKPERN